MEELFKKKFKVDSLRLQEWDYSNEGYYFVTICTKNRKNYFGEVKNDIMGLSEMGIIVWEEWLKTEKVRQNIKLDQFIVMPNHVHGVIEIVSPSIVETFRRNVSTGNDIKINMSKISPTAGSLSVIIRFIKSECTKRARKLGYKDFAWQERFYDHVIRIDKESLEKIRYYIRYNPATWARDRNNISTAPSN